MDHCVLKDCKTILQQFDKNINRSAFGGCCFYFTVQGASEIVKTDASFNVIETFRTDREYDCICYDTKENCIWASVRQQFQMIYKLNINMAEIDCIAIKGYRAAGSITGISFNCCSNSIVVSYHTCLFEINKCTGMAAVLHNTSGFNIIGVLSLCPIYIIIAVKNNQSYIYILDKRGQIIDSCQTNCTFMLRDILFNPCQAECGRIYLDFIGVSKDKCIQICKWLLSICDLKITICPCNFICCKKCRPETCCCHKDSCADVLESIALMEASLAHILNAEGEKLQKVLCLTDDIDKILCINREINKTLINATHLEHTLYAKLSALCECGICGQNGSSCRLDCKCKKK